MIPYTGNPPAWRLHRQISSSTNAWRFHTICNSHRHCLGELHGGGEPRERRDRLKMLVWCELVDSKQLRVRCLWQSPMLEHFRAAGRFTECHAHGSGGAGSAFSQVVGRSKGVDATF